MRHSQNLSEYDGKTYAFTVSEDSNNPTGGDIYDGKSYTAIHPVKYMDLEGNVLDWTATILISPPTSA